MQDLFKPTQCGANPQNDVVELSFGEHHIVLYYQTTFKIAAGLLMSAKFAGRHEGVSLDKWLIDIKAKHYQPVMPMHHEFRRTNRVTNVSKWSVTWENNLVVLCFDDTVIKLHFGDAFELYPILRLAAKDAKAWAGDKGRYWNTRAVLTDAAVDDKIVYA